MAKQGLHINIYRVRDGLWRCDLKLNTSKGGEGITIRGTNEVDEQMMMGSWWNSVKDKLSAAGKALSKARVIAKGVLSNPALAQAFPQYVAPALIALDAMEKAEKHGILPTVAKKLSDPTMKKLARELNEMSNGQRTAMSGGGILLACDSPTSTRMRGNERTQQQGTVGPDTPYGNRPFGLPAGNPHPFAASVRAQLFNAMKQSPLTAQKLARMTAYQRNMARAMR
jgi:hypothetical protein